MELNTLLALFVFVLGVVIYWVTSRATPGQKLNRIAEIMMLCGLLVALLVLSGKHAEASFRIK